MFNEGPRYDWAARSAAEIVNLHMHSSDCKAVVYGRILFCVLQAMYEADQELQRAALTPSRN